jgi:hypothetical protein
MGCYVQRRLLLLNKGSALSAGVWLHSLSFCKVPTSICFCDDFRLSWDVTFNGAFHQRLASSFPSVGTPFYAFLSEHVDCGPASPDNFTGPPIYHL